MAIIDKPSDYFNTKLYTGNGGTQSITGVGFQPDWVWIKGRSVVAGHNVHDVVRGVNKQLYTNTNDAEETLTTLVTSFNSDGFSLGSNGNANSNTNTYASWNWKAGTSFSNNAGANGATLASTGSVNDTAGFSIVSYTGNTTAGATIKHGLSTVPDVMIVKARADSGGAIEWVVYHKGIPTPQNNTLCLNTTAAKVDRTIAWNDTAPTSSVFSVGTWVGTNAQVGMIAYCFSEKQGYSKFSSYVGNGVDSGPFSFCGFKPAFVLTKRTDSAGSWVIQDNKRPGYNETSLDLNPNNNEAEETNNGIDMLSNGFKQRNTDAHTNASGGTYIYMAFAENPFVASNFVPATAR